MGKAVNEKVWKAPVYNRSLIVLATCKDMRCRGHSWHARPHIFAQKDITSQLSGAVAAT